MTKSDMENDTPAKPTFNNVPIKVLNYLRLLKRHFDSLSTSDEYHHRNGIGWAMDELLQLYRINPEEFAEYAKSPIGKG